jgi:glutamate-ammonia-ligase adenylyltransferase
VTAELRAAYEFLRRLENRLQMLDDRQTHTLPTAALSRERIAVAMGYADWTALTQALDGVRGTVTRHFATLLAGTSSVSQREHAAGQTFAAAWERGADADEIASALTKVADAPACAALLAEFRGSTLVRRLDGAGRKRLDALLERCVADLASVQQPATALRRVLRILEAIGPRSAYFALLNENPAARSRLWELCGYGDFLAGQIAAAPILLDELIDESLYHALPSRAELERDAADRLLAAGDGDPEREVEALRRFQQAAVFRVAVADLTGRLPLMRVSDWLTDIAEIIVEHAMQLAWRQMIAQFGVPMCGMDSARRPVRVAAIGYGKLGGRELGYSSDLDLVFVHDSDGERQETDAAKPVDNQVFFVRLAQRIVHLLSMHSAAGRLYEVDQRLRPSGKGGMLITRIGAFAEYQRNEAWTWEHQALLHARSVAGNPELCVEFERVRTTTLGEHVKRDSLAAEVRSMRERMRRELSRAGPGQFDLKQDRGGIADVEFLAQYWALRHAREHPPVAMFSDTIRQLESLASADLVPQAEVDQLVGAYRAYRTRTHRLSLEGGLPVVADSEFTAERAAVVAIWGTVFGAAA